MKARSSGHSLLGIVVVAVAVALLSVVLFGTASDAPASAGVSTPGVTKTTIKVGVSQIDLSSVVQYTSGLTQGDFQGAFTALIANLNKNGGIDGRKIVPTFVNPNPLQSSSAAAACTQLTEDDNVFAVIGQFYSTDPQCYVAQHATPVVGGTMTNAGLAAAKAPWFTAAPNADVLEPAAVAAAAKAGVFKGKTVGVLSSSDANPGVFADVVATLRRSGVTPKVTATAQANPGDPEATFQQVSGVFVPKFQSDGVNVLVAIGEASTTWVDATGDGSYHPLLVGTNYPDMTAAIAGGAKANAAVVANAVSIYTKPLVNADKAVGWADPSLQRCVKIDQAAGVKFSNPVTVTNAKDDSYAAVSVSCQVMALFTAILAKAGKNLTDASFAAAGNSLGAVEVPGMGTAVYSKSQPAGAFPLYLYRWNVAKQQWVVSSKSYGST